MTKLPFDDNKIRHDSDDVTHVVRNDSVKGNADNFPAFFAWIIAGAKLSYAGQTAATH